MGETPDRCRKPGCGALKGRCADWDCPEGDFMRVGRGRSAYTPPPLEELSAPRRAEYWKAEHLAANREIDRLRAEVAQLREERDRMADFLVREGYQRCDSACNCGEWHGSKWQRRHDECREERDAAEARAARLEEQRDAVLRRVIAAGAALVEEDHNEAYHHLYQLLAADLGFSELPDGPFAAARALLTPTGGDHE